MVNAHSCAEAGELGGVHNASKSLAKQLLQKGPVGVCSHDRSHVRVSAISPIAAESAETSAAAALRRGALTIALLVVTHCLP